MKRIVRALLAVALIAASRGAEAQFQSLNSGQSVTPTGTSATLTLSQIAARANAAQNYAIGLSSWLEATQNNYSTTQAGETDRVLYTTRGPVTRLQLFLPTQTGNLGQEIPAYNPVFYIASVEYPLGGNSTPPQFTLAGQTPMVAGINGAGVLTDPLGINIPANTQFAIRYATFVAMPPASLAAAGSTTGGTLAAATYYYKETCVRLGVESGPTAEQNVTTTGTTSSVTLTATATSSAVGCDTIKIYRSTTTGTETYLATLPGPGLIYVDTGAVATTAGATPPAAQRYSYTGTLPTGFSSSGSLCGGSQTNNVNGAGTFGITSYNSCFTNFPMVVGDDTTSFPVCGLGDSIQSGTGIQLASVYQAGLDLRAANWFTQSLPQGIYNVLNLSLPSSRAATFAGTAYYGGALRQRALDFCAYVVSDLGTNDIYASVTWQNLALSQIQIAQAEYQRGKTYFITTLLPRGSTTDNMITEANYTVGAQETARVNYNTWVRAGMQLNAGVPVTSGGTPTPYIAGYFDMAAALGETNASNVPTMNGGYWPVPASAYGSGAIAAGSSGQTYNYGSWTGGANGSYAFVGMVMKMTSGTASGQTCVVNTGNTTGIIYCGSGITTASLSVGDTFSIYQTIGFDGTHPSQYGHNLISSGNGATGFAAWAATNLTPH